MESTGKANRVHISSETEACLQHVGATDFDIAARGDVDVKGKGVMHTYWVTKK